jgi:hypothetical protein
MNTILAKTSLNVDQGQEDERNGNGTHQGEDDDNIVSTKVEEVDSTRTSKSNNQAGGDDHYHRGDV